MSFKGLVKNSVSSEERKDTRYNVMQWIWNKHHRQGHDIL